MHDRFRSALVACLLALCVLVPSVAAEEPDGLYTPRQRFGVDVATNFQGIPDFPGSLADFKDVETVGFGWYSDWTVRLEPERPGDIEFAQLLGEPPFQGLDEIVLANPGPLWIIGNEPETGGQGQMTPAEYADLYHANYHHIKALDTTAQVAIGGVVQPTPLRLKWLDLCLRYYEDTYGERMPIDVWNIHVQILQEGGAWGCGIPYGLTEDVGRQYTINDNCDVEVFRELILEFCAWLVAHDERNKPLIISEYGTLMPSSYLPYGDQSVTAFMHGTFDFLLSARDATLGYSADGGRLVQRWSWFSLNFPLYDEHPPDGFNGSLYAWDHPDRLTVFGEFYRDYTLQLAASRVYLPLAFPMPRLDSPQQAAEWHRAAERPRADTP